MKRKQNLKTLASLLIAAPALGLSFAASPQLAWAQTDAPAAALKTEEAAKPQLDLAAQKKLASELFELTKTAKSTEQLNTMIAQCDAAVEAGLNQKYDTYVGSLKAWAVKRHGEKLAAEKKLAGELFRLTKTAKSTQQLNEMIAQCDTATEAGLSKKYHTYVRSLKALALTRRGENRYETAKQLKSIDNIAQYKLAIAQCLADFDDSIVIDTAQYRTFNARGIAYILDEQYKAAARDFGKAIVLRADFTQGYFNRAEALSALGRPRLAIKDYTSVLRLTPEDAQALTGRGHAYVAMKNFEAALADYNSVIKANPTNALALINRGDCREAAGQWQASLADYAAAKKLAGSSANKLTDMADQRTSWVLASASDASVRDAEKALALIGPCVDRSSSPSVAMLETLAAAQAATGRFEEAKQNQTKAIQLTGAEVEVDENQAAGTPHQVRMALYVDEKPFVQPTPAEPKK